MAVSPDLAALAPWAALMALALLAWLSALGSPVLGFVAELLADARSTVFYRKFAQQMSKAGLLWLLTALLLAGLAAALRTPEARALIATLLGRPDIALPPAAALACLILFSLLHATTWTRLKGSRGLHKLLGLLAAASGLASVWLLLSLSRLLANLDPKAVEPTTFTDHLFIPAASPFWPGLGAALLLALACSGGMGLAYALLRRNRDDWGRDYYGFALRLGAQWTLACLLVSAGFLAWLAWTVQPDVQGLLADAASRVGGITAAASLVLALTAYLVVWRSDAPLRQKPAILTAALLLLLLLAGICLLGMRHLAS